MSKRSESIGADPELHLEFAKMYENFYQKIYMYALQGVSSEQDAADIAADVFEAVWMNFNELNSGKVKSVSGYIYQIASHKISDFFRRVYKKAGVLESFELLENMSDVDHEGDPERMVDARLRTARIENAMAQIPSRHSRALEIMYLQDGDLNQVATTLQIKENAAKQALSRARNSLSNQLSEDM